MNIKNLFKVSTKQENNVLLSTQKDNKSVKHIAVSLKQQTDALTRKDIATWREAWQRAIDVENPNREMLYDIYRDVEVDAHLWGCVQQRTGVVMARTFKIIDKNGNTNEQASLIFNQQWFKQLCKLCLQSIYWGHSLIELGEITYNESKPFGYTNVSLIPRKHVISEYGRVVAQLGDNINDAINYRIPPYSQYLIEAGETHNLGLLLKAAQHTIPKKNMTSFWDTFGEVFGMPIRVAKTASRDKKDIERLNKMLIDAGASQTAVLPIDTELNFIESTRSDAYNVYKQRIDQANAEISKLILGQTMTIDNGASLSQSQTHLKVFQLLVEDDADFLRDIINNQLIPKMIEHGFDINECAFEWDYSVDYTPEQQVAYETMIADRYNVDPKYFAEKYSMPVGEQKSNTPISLKKNSQNRETIFPKPLNKTPKTVEQNREEFSTEENQTINTQNNTQQQQPFFD